MRGVRRWQGFEIHELPSCPHFLRRAVTDFLRLVIGRTHLYRNVLPLLAALLRRRPEAVVDLCAGGGGPWPELQADLLGRLGRLPAVVHTDLHPNPSAAAELRRVDGRAIDARRVPADLAGIRTMFTAFHHFTARDATAILVDAQRRGSGLLICEMTSRSVLHLLGCFTIPFACLLLSPVLAQRDLRRWCCIWLIPLIPLILFWDGLASCLRSYHPREIRRLAQRAGLPAQAVRSGRAPLHGIPHMAMTWAAVLPQDAKARPA